MGWGLRTRSRGILPVLLPWHPVYGLSWTLVGRIPASCELAAQAEAKGWTPYGRTPTGYTELTHLSPTLPNKKTCCPSRGPREGPRWLTGLWEATDKEHSHMARGQADKLEGSVECAAKQKDKSFSKRRWQHNPMQSSNHMYGIW
eukprot:jgi/Botrbrau1/13398/Bobra.0082s0005.1